MSNVPDHPWWPTGATEAHVRACACDTCRELAARLDAARGDAPATRDGDASLAAFGGDA